MQNYRFRHYPGIFSVIKHPVWLGDHSHGFLTLETVFAISGTNVHEQSRTDFCRLRFKTSGFSKMLAISQRLGAPGKDIYNSGWSDE